ncbi:MAG TPA: hypothetical protein VHG88_00275 [Burkholderiales bacterium]|nr:hypothetical protein [Burkholderiales bacterium]
MTRFALPLCIAAALGLSACGSDPNTMDSRTPRAAAAPAAAPANTLPYRAGSGVVQSVTAAPRAAASAGGTTPVTTTRGDAVTTAGASAGTSTFHRLAIRMDDGRVQYVDMAGPDVPPVGTRVQLTADHQIIRQ